VARLNFDQANNSEEVRSGLRRLVVSVELADLLGLLMILATAFSAYSTWRTAQLAGQLLLITARPYLGNKAVYFDRTDTGEPRVVADLRNFGSVQAINTTIDGRLLFNGHPIGGKKGPRSTIFAGVFSPNVPHPTYFHLPADTYREAIENKGKLQLRLEMRYAGPSGDRHCYSKSFTYDSEDGEFYSDHGTLSCR
jgi:hypothetical protein